MNRLFTLLLISVALISAAKVDDLVTTLPGFVGEIPFAAYAGYLSANDGQKNMFYFFAESQNDPASDPVVLWLNGGPGCSSFDGFIYEHGPFTFNDGPMGINQNLTLNPYSWNMAANMIYLDSPCGVGLSYSTNPNVDYNTNDIITAHDSHNFLLNFFAAYPEFASNRFYIAGESYAGIYVPTLAQQVMLGNKKNPSTKINMQGILVGNGVTDEVFDGNALLPFIYGHSLISDEIYNEIIKYCGVNIWNVSYPSPCYDILYNNASYDIQYLNIYNIYVDCYGGGAPSLEEDIFSVWDRVTKKYRDEIKRQSGIRDDVPCIDSSRADAWLNLQEVRTALHAISVEDVEWTICSGAINYTSVYSTVIPIHQQLLENGYQILIYSGDTDMCVPNTGSQAWTNSLNLPVVDEWRPWFVNSQVAGYVRQYKGLTFATIKGAGHTVPEYKPPQALYFFTQFLNGQPF